MFYEDYKLNKAITNTDYIHSILKQEKIWQIQCGLDAQNVTTGALLKKKAFLAECYAHSKWEIKN